MSTGRLLITLDPRDISRSFVRRSPRDKLRFGLNGLGQPAMVRTGNWDQRTIPVTDHPGYRLIRELADHRFDPGRSYETLVRYFRDKGRSPGKARKKATNELTAYVRQYEALFSSMSANGYVEGLGADEIGLALDRAGRWIKVPNGNHRFHVALVLGLPRVTAEVRFVHRQWLVRRAGAPLRDIGPQISTTLQERGLSARWLPDSV